MKTIHKYEINPDWIEGHKISMPKDSEVLTAQMQDNKVVLWVVVDDDRPKKERTFICIMTGQNLDNVLNHHYHTGRAWEYISTVQRNGIVVHVFEKF